mgnify:CR=1 FL=1
MITIYHNPRCSKSRACLLLLKEATDNLEVVDYSNNLLSLERLRELAAKLGLNAMLRNNEALYKELHLEEADDETILNALKTHPQLLQRPIVVVGEQMLIARPPEKVLELINV